MKRLALLAALLFSATCADNRVAPTAIGVSAVDGGMSNNMDENDDFHSLPHADGAEGSHFRLGHFSWRKTGPLTAEFTYVVGFRRSFFGAPVVGSVLSVATINFGAGQGSLTPPFTVTFVDAANDWFEARAVFSKTYTTVGPHAVTSTGCCRIGISSTPGWAHMNNPDDQVQYWGTVNLNYSGSPASTLPPMVTCAMTGTCTFFVSATAPAGLNVRWRLATPLEMSGGIAGSVQPGPPQAPSAASINSTSGLYSWTTTGAAVFTGSPARKSVYSTMVVMEGVDPASGTVVTRSIIDFLILLANIQQNAPPAFQPPTPLDGSSYTVNPGQSLTLNLTATDADAGDVVTISGLGLPLGSSLVGTPGNPANSVFSYTATLAQAGQSFSVSFSPTDNKGLSGSQRSIVINVPANQPPTSDITGPTQAPEGSGVMLDGSGSTDPDSDQLHYAWTVNTAPAGGDSPTLSLQAGDGPALLTIGLTVTDGKGGSSTTTHEVTVNNVAPFGTFSAQTPVNEGQSFALSLSNVGDPSAADIAAIVQASFDCGDGGGYGAYSNALSATCPTSDNGGRNVQGRLRDKDGGVTEYTGLVTVNNVAPTVNAGPDVTITSGQIGSFLGTFTDPGINDAPWNYAWNFAGGTGTTNVLGGPIPGSLQFCTAGAFTVTLAVTDKDGGTGSDDLSLTVNRLPVTIRVLPEAINLLGDRQNNGNGNGGGAPSGMVIVHVYSSGDFDATQLNPLTLRLTNESGSGTPVALRNNGTPYFQTNADVNGDGRNDAIIHFNRADLIANGDLTSATTQLMLLGDEGVCRQVRGVDDVRVVH